MNTMQDSDRRFVERRDRHIAKPVPLFKRRPDMTRRPLYRDLWHPAPTRQCAPADCNAWPREHGFRDLVDTSIRGAHGTCAADHRVHYTQVKRFCEAYNARELASLTSLEIDEHLATAETGMSSALRRVELLPRTGPDGLKLATWTSNL